MSVSSLYAFHGKVATEDSISTEVVGDIEYLSRYIRENMDDRVGHSASDSAISISTSYSSSANNIIKKCNDAKSDLERGYCRIDGICVQGEKLLDEAKRLVKELGELQ